jgi:para-nitrobenzyl esterase
MHELLGKKWLSRAAWMITFVGLAGCGGGSSQGTPVTSIVTLTNGTVVGNDRDSSGVLSFKGIPYAAPPVENLRWKAPQSMPNWTVAKDAKQYGKTCWASGLPPVALVPANATASEDCLFLNVWTGAEQAKERRAVMVWLHGGGFQFGTSGDSRWEGNNLAKKGVVVVSLNYRLGVFGHLARNDLDTESGASSGMYGLQDQLAALKWVRANIASFGGDPDNITLFGESAGAHAVGMLSSSPLAAGLFQKAIGQSGAFWESRFGRTPPHAAVTSKGAAFGDTLGARSLAALRALPAASLLEQAGRESPFGPSVDGQVLTEEPAVRFAAGRQIDMPLLVGQNQFEGDPFFRPGFGLALPSTATAFSAAFTTALGTTPNVTNALTATGLYPSDTDANALTSSQQLLGDLTIGFQTWAWGVGQKVTGKSPVYSYFFNQSGSPLTAYTPSAIHVSEVPYVFQNLVPKVATAGPQAGVTVLPAGQDLELADVMSSYWTNFAKTGNPNGGGLTAWPEYSGAGGTVMNLGTTVAAAPEAGTPRLARYRFLSGFRSATGSLIIRFLP